LAYGGTLDCRSESLLEGKLLADTVCRGVFGCRNGCGYRLWGWGERAGIAGAPGVEQGFHDGGGFLHWRLSLLRVCLDEKSLQVVVEFDEVPGVFTA
jgi:hypothetical protein